MKVSVKVVLKSWEVVATCGNATWVRKFFTQRSAVEFADTLNVEGSGWTAEVRKVQ